MNDAKINVGHIVRVKENVGTWEITALGNVIFSAKRTTLKATKRDFYTSQIKEIVKSN